MSGISYSNKKIIPASFLNISKSYNVTSDGTPVGSLFNIQLQGTFLPNKGSPTSSGTFWVASGSPADETILTDDFLTAIIRKQEALRDLFSIQGAQFRVDAADGKSYLTCNPRIKGQIRFPAGNTTSWANRCQYEIDLEADVIYKYDQGGNLITEDTGLVSGFKLESADETWNLEIQDENLLVFRFSHQVNAKGKRFYSSSGTLDKQAWQNAQDYVLGKLGLNSDRLYASGVLNLTGYSGYNYLRSENINELNGTFAVTETWLSFAPGVSGYHATEDFEVNTRTAEDGLTSVSLQGKVQGFNVRNNNTYGAIESTKYFNASGKYQSVSSSFLGRAQNYAGITLNPILLNKAVGHNPIAGTINYTFEYNDRPTASVSGARSETIAVTYENQADIFAELNPIGRAAGPILQDIGTKTSRKINVSIDAILKAASQSFSPTQPDTNVLVSGYAPVGYTWIFKNRDTENFSSSKGTYSRQTSWTYGS